MTAGVCPGWLVVELPGHFPVVDHPQRFRQLGHLGDTDRDPSPPFQRLADHGLRGLVVLIPLEEEEVAARMTVEAKLFSRGQHHQFLRHDSVSPLTEAAIDHSDPLLRHRALRLRWLAVMGALELLSDPEELLMPI